MVENPKIIVHPCKTTHIFNASKKFIEKNICTKKFSFLKNNIDFFHMNQKIKNLTEFENLQLTEKMQIIFPKNLHKLNLISSNIFLFQKNWKILKNLEHLIWLGLLNCEGKAKITLSSNFETTTKATNFILFQKEKLKTQTKNKKV